MHLSEAEQNFIEKNINSDPAKLTLAGFDKFLIRQIISRKKAELKLPSFLNKEIIFPSKISIEQSTSEKVARLKAKFFSGSNFYDLTGGFGIDFYFMKSQFEKGIYVEKDPELCKLAENNFKVLGVENFEILNDSAENVLKIIEYSDLIYLDPARRDDSNNKLINPKEYSPNIIEIQKQLLSKSKEVAIKVSPMIDIFNIKDLIGFNKVIALESDGELKEIMLLKSEEVKFIIGDTKTNIFFDYSHTSQYESFSLPKQYIYELSPAEYKLSLNRSIAESYNLTKLSRYSYFYSDNLEEDFRGNIYKVKETLSKNDLKKYKATGAILKSRYYPEKPNVIRKKYKLPESSSLYLFFEKFKSKTVIFEATKVK
jgi:16S rRNA G966 N2-methylase RsmD